MKRRMIFVAVLVIISLASLVSIMVRPAFAPSVGITVDSTTTTQVFTYANVCPSFSYNYGNLIFITGCTFVTTSSSTVSSSLTTSSSTTSSTSTTLTSSSSTVSGVVCLTQTTGIPSNKFAIGQVVHYIGSNPSISTASVAVQAIYCGNQANMFGPPYTGNGWSYWLGSGYFAEDMLAAG